ncbi:MAG TPA: HigA family addiction module antitoxin [Candidatus Cybelea sp.]|nr:HigA family addiction module antitoxin [Candidatus Cybelea sp.]
MTNRTTGVPVHPGALLKRELAARDLSANALARALRVPPNRIIEILNGRRALSADTALRLGHYFGNGGRFWLTLQGNYDLAVAERDSGRRIAREVSRAA